MKRIILIRHAKAVGGDSSLADFDRPLNKRGLSDAVNMSDALASLLEFPELIMASPALRSTKTADIFSSKMNFPKKQVLINTRLYLAEKDVLSNVISSLPDKHQSIVIFAHNPGITEFVNSSTEENIANLPTCGIAVIDIKSKSWKTAINLQGKLRLLISPRLFY